MKLRTALSAFVLDVHRAQRALFDDHIRLDHAADPADLPRVPLHWRRTLGGWELEGFVLPDQNRHPCGRSC